MILQTVLGFDAATIASAFLVSPGTMGQRLVRAKEQNRQAGIPFRLPERADLRERLGAVLAAIYAAFSEGWSDPAGTEFRRRNLAEEGIWLGRWWPRCCGRARGTRPVGPDASCGGGGVARGAIGGRIRAAGGAGSAIVEHCIDRGGRGHSCSGEPHGHDRPLSAGSAS